MSISLKQSLVHVKILQQFVSAPQIAAMAEYARGEEKDFFLEQIKKTADTFSNMPKTYEQDGKGDEAIVHLHYFLGGMDWYITEKDQEDEQIQAFGYVDLGYGGELGYISLPELAANNVELDMYWEPQTLAKVKANR